MDSEIEFLESLLHGTDCTFCAVRNEMINDRLSELGKVWAICGWCGKHLEREYKGVQLFCSDKCCCDFRADGVLSQKGTKEIKK